MFSGREPDLPPRLQPRKTPRRAVESPRCVHWDEPYLQCTWPAEVAVVCCCGLRVPAVTGCAMLCILFAILHPGSRFLFWTGQPKQCMQGSGKRNWKPLEKLIDFVGTLCSFWDPESRWTSCRESCHDYYCLIVCNSRNSADGPRNAQNMPFRNCRQARKEGLWRNSALEWEDFSEYKIDLHLFNIVMENGPFIDDFPINTSIYKGFSMAMLNNQMVRPPFHSSHPLSVTRKKLLTGPPQIAEHRQEKTDFGFYCCSQLLAVYVIFHESNAPSGRSSHSEHQHFS